MSFEVYDVDDPRWSQVLSTVAHDVYHLPGYARVCETYEPWAVRLAAAVSSAAALVLPFMRRELPGGEPGCDITVPYGYPGPLCSSNSIETQTALFGELVDGFRDMGAVSVFLRCHPLLGISLDAIRPFGEVVVHGDQVYLDLEHTPEPLEASFRRRHRYGVNMLRKRGFTLRIDDEGDRGLFPALYRENMQRLDADDYYCFNDAYFDAIWTQLADESHIVAAVAPDGRAAAMALVLVCGKIAQYHLSCTDPDFTKLAPSKLSIYGMAELSRSLGVELLNLGGGVGGRADSLLEFKAGFSDYRAPFATAQLILDRVRYDELARNATPTPGFFPAYRSGF